MTAVLVDSSVWINFLRQRKTSAVEKFNMILDHQQPFGITPVIFQEVLQGADSHASFERLKDYLSSQRFFPPLAPVASHAAAAEIYFQCRRAGITIRSTIDCLIAQTAIEQKLLLLHEDQDFVRIKTVIPELQFC